MATAISSTLSFWDIVHDEGPPGEAARPPSPARKVTLSPFKWKGVTRYFHVCDRFLSIYAAVDDGSAARRLLANTAFINSTPAHEISDEAIRLFTFSF